MFDYHEKRKIRSWVYSKFSIGVLFALSVWMSIAVYERFSVEREMAHKRAEVVAELGALKERAAVLESKVESLHNERGLEEELRRRFDVAKEGEQVVIIVDDSKPTDLADPDVLPQEDSPWWSWLTFWR